MSNDLHEWGSAHSIFHRELFYKLIFFCGSQIEFEKPIDWGEKNILYAKIYSPRLPTGYHGHMDIIYEDDRILRFKRDADV